MNNSLDSSYKEYAKQKLRGKQNIMSSFFLVYPFLKDKKVLDIGCSDGLYLKFFRPDSIGIEQITELASRARSLGLNVLQGQIPVILPEIPPNSYSAAFLSHILEHLESPILCLEQINRILEPDGYLVLGLPTENNMFRHILRKDYFNGTHLYSFSVKNGIKLSRLTGFFPIRVFYDLPKCQGPVGRFIIRTYQHFPFKERISMAYWIVAKKL